MNKVVDKLKKRKKELGLTNKALSTTSGVPYGTVCRVLANNIDGTPNWQTIKDLAQAMGMSMEELLDEEQLEEEESSGYLLCGKIYEDRNGNGQQDEDEIGLPDIDISVYICVM